MVVSTIEGEVSRAKLDAHTAKVENSVRKVKGKEKATQESYDELGTYVQNLEARVAVEKKEREKWLKKMAGTLNHFDCCRGR